MLLIIVDAGSPAASLIFMSVAFLVAPSLVLAAIFGPKLASLRVRAAVALRDSDSDSFRPSERRRQSDLLRRRNEVSVSLYSEEQSMGVLGLHALSAESDLPAMSGFDKVSLSLTPLVQARSEVSLVPLSPTYDEASESPYPIRTATDAASSVRDADTPSEELAASRMNPPSTNILTGASFISRSARISSASLHTHALITPESEV
jgi:hypothetical protein